MSSIHSPGSKKSVVVNLRTTASPDFDTVKAQKEFSKRRADKNYQSSAMLGHSSQYSPNMFSKASVKKGVYFKEPRFKDDYRA